MSVSLEVAAALTRANEVTAQDISEWTAISKAAIKMGLFEPIETFTAFHQTADNIAYNIFIHTLSQYSADPTAEPDDEFFVMADTMSEIMHALSVGSGVHPDLTEAYVTCLVDTRMEALMYHINSSLT